MEKSVENCIRITSIKMLHIHVFNSCHYLFLRKILYLIVTLWLLVFCLIMLVVVMCSSVTIRSLAKIFSSRSCGNRKRGAGTVLAIRGAAAQARSLPAPSSLAVARNRLKCRFAARQKRRAAYLVQGWGAVALARAVRCARITRAARPAPALPFRRLEAFEVFAFLARPWLAA